MSTQPKALSLIKPLTPEQLENIIEMLDSWSNVSEEEAQEQKETLQYLMKALEITE